MVSQETTTTTTSTSTTNPISPSSSSSSSMLLHQFILSSSTTTTNPISNANNNSQYQFDHHNPNNYNPFGSFLRPNINNTYPFESTTLQQHQGCGFPTNPYQVVGSFGEEDGGSIQQSSDESRMNHHNNRHHLMDLLHQAPNDSSSSSSRLSLSLGSQGFISPMQYHQHQHHLGSAGEEAATGFMGGISDSSFMGNTTTANNNNNNNFSLTVSPLLYSRYLRPAQLLLEEMVNVGGRAVELNEVKELFYGRNRVSSSELRDELLSFAAAEHTEISSASPKSHDFQNQGTILSKLIGLLEQVESRYQDYCQRMEEVVSAFEGVAGDEAAKTYTAVALQAMCKHFCILREAILFQVKLARKTLSTTSSVGLSRLSLFNSSSSNNNSNNNRVVSLHQGHRQQAWRPIRGLPETSVAILRAWLFEHFLHPYPNDSEKLILASQTGLTKNQVSNWFINARVRLWKPMIEEMYKDEFGESSSADSDPLFSTSC